MLPAPGQIQGWWWALGCLGWPRLLERAGNTCRGASGPQHGQRREAAAIVGGGQEWQRGTGCPRGGSSPLPIPAQTPGVSPQCVCWGQSLAKGVKKQQKGAALNHRSPFYCTVEQGRDTSTCPMAQLNPASSSTGQDTALEAGGTPPCPPAPHTGPVAGARAGLGPIQPGLGRRGNGGHVLWQRVMPSSGHFHSPGTLQPTPNPHGKPMPAANGAKGAFRPLREAEERVRRGGSRCGKAAIGRRARAARLCQCSRHHNACTGWPRPLPQKGAPAPRGRGESPSAGQSHPTSRLCQRELLQAFLAQPVPGEVLAGDHAHHLPGQGHGRAPRWQAERWDKPRLPIPSEQDSPHCDCSRPPSAVGPGLGRA